MDNSNDEYNFLEEEATKLKSEKSDIFELEEIDTIHIMIQSNLPETPMFPFTKYMLYSPLLEGKQAKIKIDMSKLSEYPFFTNEIKYPKSELIQMSYEEIVLFFFDKEEFKSVIQRFLSNKTKTYGINNENNEFNIMTMIELLFPTVNPYKNNFNTSLNEYIYQSKYNNNTLFPNNNYTYLRYNETIYTISKITWLNDFLNHPLYKTLITEYIKFKKWAIVQNANIDMKIKENQKKIQSKIIAINYDTELSNLKSYIDRLINQIYENRIASEYIFIQKENADNFINIFQILNIYKKYIGKKTNDENRNQNIANFNEEIKPYLMRYKPKLNDDVEVKIGNYWYSAKIEKINIENNTYDLKINTLLLKTGKEISLLSFFDIPLDNIRKPLLQQFLNKENNNDFYFEVSNSKRENKYGNLQNFMTHYWGEKMIKKDFSTMIDTNISYDDSALSDITQTPEIKTVEILKYYDYHNADNTERKNMIKRHYRISDKFKKNEEKKTIDEILNNQLELLKYIFQKGIMLEQITSNVRNKLEECISIFNSFEKLRRFQNDYLNNYKVDINEPINIEIKEYIDYVNTIKKYIAPKMISTNSKLQNIINNYANNIDSKTFINFMDLCAPCIYAVSGRCDIIQNYKFSQLINTDLNIMDINDEYTKYFVFLHFDFVEGQLDRAIKSDKGIVSRIKCSYNDSLLTKQFNDLIYKGKENTWTLKSTPFIKVKTPGRKIKKLDDNIEQPIYPQVLAQNIPSQNIMNESSNIETPTMNLQPPTQNISAGGNNKNINKKHSKKNRKKYYKISKKKTCKSR